MQRDNGCLGQCVMVCKNVCLLKFFENFSVVGYEVYCGLEQLYFWIRVRFQLICCIDMFTFFDGVFGGYGVLVDVCFGLLVGCVVTFVVVTIVVV